MAKDKTQYARCASSAKWLGKCPGCGEWNTLEETVAEASSAARHRYQSLAKTQAVATPSEIEAAAAGTIGYELMCALARRVPAAVG